MKVGDNFCVYPFLQLHLTSRGAAKPCCAFETEIEEGGRALTPRENSVDELWNSKFMKDVRRRMAEGSPVPECGYCTRYEGRGFKSIGRRGTEGWKSGWLNPEGRTLEQLASAAEADGYRIARPEWVDLHVGNGCNLKCRMCYSYYSSQIAADPVHRAWEDSSFDLPGSRLEDERPAGGWTRREEFVFEDLLKATDRPRTLRLIGGEPTLSKKARDIMRRLAESGAARNIDLSLVTNATDVDDDWCSLASAFRTVSMAASLDGFDSVNHYIRHPAVWRGVEASLARLRRVPTVHVYVNATVQAYNVLDLVPLVEWCEGAGLEFKYTMLEIPVFLDPAILPAAVRREAARRLRAHAEKGTACGPELRLLADVLEAPRGDGDGDGKLIREFMIFTNDLDASRGQDFGATFPELRSLLAVSGIDWTSDRRYAR